MSHDFGAAQFREVSLKGNVYDFSIDYNGTDKSDILNIHKYLVVKNNIMFWLVKQVFIVLLSFSGSLATKCVSVNNEPCRTRPTLIDLNHVKFNYYPFRTSLDKCNESRNAVDDLSTKICIPSETKGVNVKVFNMITRINEAKT